MKRVSVESCLKVFFCEVEQIKEVIAGGEVGMGAIYWGEKSEK